MPEDTQPLIVSGGGDIFEITDFTVVTDSEQFIVTIENVLHEWNLTGSSSSGVKRPRSRPFPSVSYFVLLSIYEYVENSGFLTTLQLVT